MRVPLSQGIIFFDFTAIFYGYNRTGGNIIIFQFPSVFIGNDNATCLIDDYIDPFIYLDHAKAAISNSTLIADLD